MNVTTRTLRVGTRASLLARIQTGLVVDALGVPVEIVPVITAGDRSAAAHRDRSAAPASSSRRCAMPCSRGEIDVAVHSYKDLPTAPADGIVIAAVPLREDPRDALVAAGGRVLGELPPGARVGTGSPRRAAQLRALGLGLDDRARSAATSTPGWPRSPAVNSTRSCSRWPGCAGSVAPTRSPRSSTRSRCCRRRRRARWRSSAAPTTGPTLEALARDRPRRQRGRSVAAERALLAALEAGCTAPVGALGEVAEGDDGQLELFLRGSVTALDGSDAVRLSATGSYGDPDGLGRRLADDLIANGAQLMMGSST